MLPRKIITATLLAFVAACVGYGAGRKAGLWGPLLGAAPAHDHETLPAGPPALPDRAAVFYLHDAQRCDTCIRTGRMTADLIRREFASAMNAGRLEWRSLATDSNPDMTRRYDVAGPSVIVVEIRGGREKRFTRLDDLWKLLDDRPGFDARVGAVIRQSLPGELP